MVALPQFKFFVSCQNGEYIYNTFTGSLGTDPKAGCFASETINFKVYAKHEDTRTEPEILMVECWVLVPYKKGAGCEKTEYRTKEFECSESGRLEAEAWLTAETAAYN